MKKKIKPTWAIPRDNIMGTRVVVIEDITCRSTVRKYVKKRDNKSTNIFLKLKYIYFTFLNQFCDYKV